MHFTIDTLWLVIALVALIAVIVRAGGHTQVIGMLDARAERIRKELEEAQRLREEAQRTLAEIEQRQKTAQSEAETIVEHARAEAERLRETTLAELAETFERREKLALERIAQAEANVAAQLRSSAADIASAAASGLIAAQLDDARRGALADVAIDELSGKLH